MPIYCAHPQESLTLIGHDWFVAQGWLDETNVSVVGADLVVKGDPQLAPESLPVYRTGIPLPDSIGDVWLFYFKDIERKDYLIRLHLMQNNADHFICFPVSVRSAYAGVVQIFHPNPNAAVDGTVFAPLGVTSDPNLPPVATLKANGGNAVAQPLPTKLLPGEENPRRWYGFQKNLPAGAYCLTVTAASGGPSATVDFTSAARIARQAAIPQPQPQPPGPPKPQPGS
jgi:hypothetical protein